MQNPYKFKTREALLRHGFELATPGGYQRLSRVGNFIRISSCPILGNTVEENEICFCFCLNILNS